MENSQLEHQSLGTSCCLLPAALELPSSCSSECLIRIKRGLMVLICISCKSAQSPGPGSFPAPIRSLCLSSRLTAAPWWAQRFVICTRGFHGSCLFGTRMPELGSGSRILKEDELNCTAVPRAGLGSSEGPETSVPGASWAWMSSPSSIPKLSISLLCSLPCPAVGTVAVPHAVGSL